MVGVRNRDFVVLEKSANTRDSILRRFNFLFGMPLVFDHVLPRLGDALFFQIAGNECGGGFPCRSFPYAPGHDAGGLRMTEDGGHEVAREACLEQLVGLLEIVFGDLHRQSEFRKPVEPLDYIRCQF